MLLTVSSVWIIYEVIVLVWTEFLSRKLATWEKIVLVVLGLVVAIYGGRSEHQDSVAMAKLGQTVTDTQAQLKIAKDQLAKISQQQDFSKGQLDIIGKIDARTLRTLASKTDISPNAGPDSVANAASAKVDALSRQLGDLQKQTVWQLSDNQRAELNRVLSGEKLQFLETEYIPTNDLSVMFEKELLEIFRAHNW